MIIFKKIRYKNFLSSGNQFMEIDFQKDNTNLIVGTNGAGKSTVLDALTFVLFNKAFRKINKNQLINTTNEKDCLVEIEFSVNSREYLVRRGIKPSIFDIEVNGDALHKESDDRLNQKILEDNILKLNYKSFTQIVILGSSTFVPFMQLPAAHRREIIEDLLDLQIFTSMNVILKQRITSNAEDLIKHEANKTIVEEKMKLVKKHLIEIQNNNEKIINNITIF